MDELESMLEELDGALKSVATTRGILEQKVTSVSANVDSLLAEFERVGASINAGLNHTEMFVSSLDNVLRPSEHDNPTGNSSQSAASLDQILTRIEDYVEEILPQEAATLVGDLGAIKPDHLRDGIRAVANNQLQKFDDALAWIDDKMASLVEASEQIVEASTTFSKMVDEAKETLVGSTNQLAGNVKELVGALDQLSTGGSDALSQQLTTELAEKISAEVDILTNGALKSVANFSDKAEQLTGEIIGQLAGINDTFGQILDIVEPIQPVIELAERMS